ncbi:MAG: dTDP-4-dehydrorhamnose 3,5-epimerase [Candidatus Entotheonellia bacterium]
MIFKELSLSGAYLVMLDKHVDSRGFFARTWCQQEFEQHSLVARIVQSNMSFNKHKGTLRGMHYQIAPYEETKLIRCTSGSIYDVIIDLRPDSPTYRQWVGVTLSAKAHPMLYVPAGFAHGFQTLEDDSEVSYQVSQFYAPEYERGLRYNDPAFDIKWPLDITVMSTKDQGWPDYMVEEPTGARADGRQGGVG